MNYGLDWHHDIASVPTHGIETERDASPDERAAIARALELLACSALWSRYSLHPRPGGRFRLTGELEADITQSCVVTLEPVTSRLNLSFDVPFWPAADIPEPSEGKLNLDAEAEPEPIVDNLIPLGRIVFETLAAAIDPYPRAPGAVFSWSDPVSSDEVAASPFAGLAKIRNEQGR